MMRKPLTDGEKMIWAAAFVAGLYAPGGDGEIAAELAAQAVVKARRQAKNSNLVNRDMCMAFDMTMRPGGEQGE